MSGGGGRGMKNVRGRRVDESNLPVEEYDDQVLLCEHEEFWLVVAISAEDLC